MGEKIGPGEEEIKHVETEKDRERFPTEAEVKEQLDKFVGGREVIVEKERKLKDEHGVYLWEVRVKALKKETIEYSYQRKRGYEASSGGSGTETMINVAFYFEDEFPGGGHTLATYVNGEWKYTENPTDTNLPLDPKLPIDTNPRTPKHPKVS